MTLSILIPTLESRREQFARLTSKLKQQVAEKGLEKDVEILDFPDNGEFSVGYKRNKLIEKARGRFVSFIDDDDDINDNYIKWIYETIRDNPDIDCIGFKGLITFSGKKPRLFIHSLQHKEYYSSDGIYYRPPYHLNPMRRSIAQKYKFEEIDYSEDIDWAIRICRDRVLKKESMIDEVLYYYRSRRHWLFQLMIDRTEKTRHLLGLQIANRIRLKRWLKSLFQENRLFFNSIARRKSD